MNEPCPTPLGAPQRIPAWRGLLDYFRGDEFHGELRSAAIFSAFAILGTAAFLLARQSDWLDTRDQMRFEFEANAYTLARDAHEHFAQGIPRNLAYLEEITRMHLQFEEHMRLAHAGGATPTGPCELWPGGPTCRDWEQELRCRKLEWAREVQHYAALCEEAGVIFEHVDPDWIRGRARDVGRDPPELGSASGLPPASLATDATYIRAQLDLLNCISCDQLDANAAEFAQLVRGRGGAAPEPPPGATALERAEALMGEVYGEVDGAFTRCLRAMDYGLQYHKTLRDYGLAEGQKGS